MIWVYKKYFLSALSDEDIQVQDAFIPYICVLSYLGMWKFTNSTVYNCYSILTQLLHLSLAISALSYCLIAVTAEDRYTDLYLVIFAFQALAKLYFFKFPVYEKTIEYLNSNSMVPKTAHHRQITLQYIRSSLIITGFFVIITFFTSVNIFVQQCMLGQTRLVIRMYLPFDISPNYIFGITVTILTVLIFSFAIFGCSLDGLTAVFMNVMCAQAKILAEKIKMVDLHNEIELKNCIKHHIDFIR